MNHLSHSSTPCLAIVSCCLTLANDYVAADLESVVLDKPTLVSDLWIRIRLLDAAIDVLKTLIAGGDLTACLKPLKDVLSEFDQAAGFISESANERLGELRRLYGDITQ